LARESERRLEGLAPTPVVAAVPAAWEVAALVFLGPSFAPAVAALRDFSAWADRVEKRLCRLRAGRRAGDGAASGAAGVLKEIFAESLESGKDGEKRRRSPRDL
jgi:hypothetical protein